MAPMSDDAESIALPPNRPGRIAGPVDNGEPGREPAKQRYWGEDELRPLALEEAESCLPVEIRTMLRNENVAEVAAMCNLETGASSEAIARGLAATLSDVLWAPLGGCVPRVQGAGESDVRAKLHLFWRCAVALCVMPLKQLAALSDRKTKFLRNIEEHLPPADASASVARLAHIRINLPLFAMVAEMPKTEPDCKWKADNDSRDAKAKSTCNKEDTADELQDVKGCREANTPQRIDGEKSSVEDIAGLDRTQTAAKHTYDVGYKKWESFDVDAALKDADGDRRVRTEKVNLQDMKPREPAPDFNDPVSALDEAIAKMKDRSSTAVEPSAAPEVERAVEDAQVDCAIESYATDAAPEMSACTEPAAKELMTQQSPLAPGVVAKICGLQRCPELNGQEVQLGEYLEADDRWRVSLADGSTRSVRPVNLEQPVAKADEDKARHGSAAAAKTGVDYSKWENFDVESALREVDDLDKAKDTPTFEPKVAVPESPAAQSTSAKAAQAVQKGFFNKKAVVESKTSEDAGSISKECTSNDDMPDVSTIEDSMESTAASLSKEYQKWDTFDGDDLDDLDDEEEDHGLGDLDAITGPKDEIERIRAHWRKESRKQKRASTNQSKPPAKVKKDPPMQQGPIIPRPCEYRPAAATDGSATAAKALDREYKKWKELDADKMLLDLDNEGTTQEGNAMRCNVNKGSAMMSTEGYTKDREEYELDQDIEKHAGSLKKLVAQRLKDAAGCKTEGNAFLRNGRVQDACAAYTAGLEKMELCEQASVIMADSMADKNKRLVADLHRNLAAAQLELGDFEAAKASCDAALERVADGGSDEKALYRRAVALQKLGRMENCRRDVDQLASILGDDDAAVRKLRQDLPAGCPAPA